MFRAPPLCLRLASSHRCDSIFPSQPPGFWPWVLALCVLCMAVVQFSITAWLPMYLRFAMDMAQLNDSEA